jgi:(p)ppGpp synthase/HD superfamily hydrolase
LTTLLEREKANRQHVLARMLAELRALSRGLDPGIRWCGRLKSIPSIWQKMYINRFGADQVLDIIGIRAITRHTRECYQLVERIHRRFEALGYEFNDYIAEPKPSGYQSIHTTVVSASGYPVEIQTRTDWMHALAGRGRAAHGCYKQRRLAFALLLRHQLVPCPVP